jgi:type IV secretory pathway VirB10-like protein
MSGQAGPPPDPPRDERAIAQELRLRPERPRVTRLSRKVLISLGGVGSVAVLGATIWALQPNRRSGAGTELYSTDNKTTADGLANLPRDYTGLPRHVPPLGPPLPGDLGRPIVAAQNAGQSVTIPTTPSAPGVDPEEQRRAQEREAARLSKLFAGTSARDQTAALLPTSLGDPNPGSTGLPGLPDAGPLAPGTADVRQNGQDRKLAFVNAAADKRTVSPDRLQRPASPFVVQAGTLIPGALLTGIRSDLPGQITGQVTENVYDSPTGRYLLIPQGAKLIGIYDSQVTFGQSRVLLVWTRLIMPNGQSIVLDRQQGADPQGFSGLEDQVDNHWVELFKAALLSTLLSVGSEAGTSGQENDLIQAIRQGASNSISQTGQQIVGRQLNIQPTLTIRPGFPIRVIVNRDLILAPYTA